MIEAENSGVQYTEAREQGRSVRDRSREWIGPLIISIATFVGTILSNIGGSLRSWLLVGSSLLMLLSIRVMIRNRSH